MVAVNLGDGPQVRELKAGQPQTLSLQPRVTDTVTLSLLDWQDVIDRNALGFDQLKPPGLAEVAVLGADGRPIAPADAARNRSREIVVGCDGPIQGPVIAVAGRFVHTSIRTTAGALLDGGPVRAEACDHDPIALPAGQQELLISPGEAFVVDGAQLSTRGGAAATSPPVAPAAMGAWDSSRREIHASTSPVPRVLVIPESINPGWVARTSTGARLTPVAVNGWQQGWVVPAGNPGTITLTFSSNSLYRAGLALGLALLPVLALLALWRIRRSRADEAPAHPWAPGAWAAVGVLAAGAVIAGTAGVVVGGAALGLRYAAAPTAAVARPRHRVAERRRADPGRSGTVAASLAVRRRLRRSFRECATAARLFRLRRWPRRW